MLKLLICLVFNISCELPLDFHILQKRGDERYALLEVFVFDILFKPLQPRKVLRP